jgi:hypothetical protein
VGAAVTDVRRAAATVDSMRTNRSTLGAAVLLVGALALLVGCGGSSEDGEGEGTTSTTAATTTITTAVPGPTVTTDPPTTEGPPSSDTTAPSGSVAPTTVPLLVPGQPCTAGSDPDCIDPFSDGVYVYLVGGAACMSSPVGGPMCADLDGDGRAGYPDRG